MFGDAESHQQFMGRWSSALAPLLVDFSNLDEAGRVLDVGSGTGALSFAIAERRVPCEVWGIDPSIEFVDYAKSMNRFPSRVRFEVGDAQALRFSDAIFDHSLSLLAFNFIAERKKALDNVIRLTKSGGHVSAAVWDYGSGMKMLRLFWDAAAAVDPAARALDESHMPLCRNGELAELWKQCGLEQVEERPLDITMRFPSFADYWNPLLLGQGPAGAYFRKLDAGRHQALRDEVKQRLTIDAEERPFSLTARAWAARGIVPRGH